MQNLLNNLKTLLSKEEKYMSEGILLKNVIIEDALKLEPSILKLLLSDNKIKKHFFQDIDGVFVFDKINFQKFISNKQFLPDSYTAFKNKIGLTTGNEYISEKKNVVLSWPYKDCILEGGQDKEDAKRNEVFWNETLAPDEIDRLLSPKVLTNWKKYDKDGEHAVDVISDNENLIIKGNNLLGLSSILKKYRGKVKLIYIDPPYNTGSDSFKYNDSFNHSSWLTFMKNRLQIAKELLKDDGLIFVHCDFNEDSYLKVLMDEIFKEHLYITTITVKSNSISGNKTQHKDKTILKNKDSILVYKNDEKIKLNPQYAEKTEWDTHYNSVLIKNNKGGYWIKKLKEILIEKGIIEKNYTIKPDSINDEKFYDFIFENKNVIFRGVNSIPKELEKISLENKDKVVYIENDDEKMFAYNGNRLSFLSKSFKLIDGNQKMAQLLGDLWTDIDFQNTQNEGGVSLTNGKKPEALLKRIIDLTTNENDIVMDYHFGSGTTGAVAHKTNRQYIGLEQLDYGKNDSTIRLQNVINNDSSGISKAVKWKGGGSFLYCELAKANQEYIDKINSSKDSNELKEIWKVMQEKAFISYNVAIKSINDNFSEFDELTLEDQKRFLIEVLDKNMLYVPFSEIEDIDYQISDEDKKLNKLFYGGK